MKKNLLHICKILLVVMVVSVTTMSYAQEFVPYAPDYDEIEKNIAEKGGEFYYPTLLARFKEGDTTLSLSQLRALYYGSIFQDDYDPYNTIDMKDIYAVINKENSSTKEMKDIDNQLNKLIEKHPTHVPLYVCQFINNSNLYGSESKEVEKPYHQFVMLVDAINSTGDGSSYDDAFHVITTSHEYLMMNVFGFSPKSQGLEFNKDNQYDVFEIEENEYGVEKLYFDITRSFGTLRKQHSQKQKKETPLHDFIIPINSAFILELKETKKGAYEIVETSLETFTDTLCWENDEVPQFNNDKENTIEGVFCTAKYCKNEDSKYKTVLILRSNCKNNLAYDSFVQYLGSSSFAPTSNNGAFRGARVTEMWSADDQILLIKLGNFHKMVFK